MPKSRNWCFTINNYPESRPEALKDFFNKTDTCRYLIFGKEVGEEKKTPHLQGYVHFTNPRTLRGISRLDAFSGSHLEAAKGSPAANKRYCSKGGDFTELGEIPAQGTRSDIKALVQDIKDGKDDWALIDHHPMLVAKYGRFIDRARLALSRKHAAFSPVEVITLWGDTGAGKTRLVYSQDPDVYMVPHSSGTVWFDGYVGQDAILIDDFYGWIKYGFLLRLLDGYKFDLQIKGGFTRKLWKKVYITSNSHPSAWYKTLGYPAALRRRLEEGTSSVTEMIKPEPVLVHPDFADQSDSDAPAAEGDVFEP